MRSGWNRRELRQHRTKGRSVSSIQDSEMLRDLNVISDSTSESRALKLEPQSGELRRLLLFIRTCTQAPLLQGQKKVFDCFFCLLREEEENVEKQENSRDSKARHACRRRTEAAQQEHCGSPQPRAGRSAATPTAK